LLKLNPTSASAKGSANRQSMPPTTIREGVAVRGVERDEFVTTV
jgi:hypothetical protein